MRGIMDALTPGNPAKRVVFMKAAQTGGTEAGNNWIGYVIHHSPAPMMAVQPTVEMAKRNSRQRIDSLIEESPALRDLVQPARKRDSGNTQLSKEFPGGVLIMTGANSAVGLRSMPARYLFLDEVDGYLDTIDDEGDPVSLAEARSMTFGHRRKVFLVSTPTVAGHSRIENEYQSSDQRRFFVPCPHCGHMQWLRFDRLRWENDDPDTTRYHCEGCEEKIEERHKLGMLRGGEWQATAESRDGGVTIGFHISTLYAPPGWKSWADIAREKIACGDSAHRHQVFTNTVLGETWQDRGEAPDWQRLYDRREQHWSLGDVPEDVCVLTAGADVQRAGRIEVSVWGWGPGLQSWLVDHVVIEGDPARQDVWIRMTEFVGRTWPHASGGRIGISRLAIDSGDGVTTDAVYNWVRSVRSSDVIAIKGMRGMNKVMPVSTGQSVEVNHAGKRSRHGVTVFTISVSLFKAETYRWLNLEMPTDEEQQEGTGTPDGYVHLPAGTPSEWCKQLVAEQLTTKRDAKGYVRREWEQIRERNEALDCRVYARAAAWQLGLDRWDEETWHRAKSALVPQPPAPRARRKESDWLGGRGSGKWL